VWPVLSTMAPKADPDEEVGTPVDVQSEAGVPIRWPDPPVFHGDKRQDTVTVHDWVELMSEHLALRALKGNSANGYRFAKLYLRGPALTWARTYQGKKTFLSFAEALVPAMSPFAEQHFNRDKLRRLSQRESLQAYIDMFRKQALLVTTMSNEDKVDLFVRGLKRYLQGPVRIHMLDKPKDDLDFVMKVASQIAYELGQNKDRTFESSPSTSRLNTAKSTPAPAQRKCYKCGSPDHLRANCPKGRKGGAGRPQKKPPQHARAASAVEVQENA